jgi:hypothetical protein
MSLFGRALRSSNGSKDFNRVNPRVNVDIDYKNRNG